jgi:endonuclease/exonuclease/phosphatase family metal-dependent hydrolase
MSPRTLVLGWVATMSLALASSSTSSRTVAATAPQPGTEAQVRLLAWNVGWTPLRSTRDAAAMGKAASAVGADVIGVVEGFVEKGVRKFATGLDRYTNMNSGQPGITGDKVLNGGLAAFGRAVTLVESDARAWSDCTNWGATFDCPAAKGVLFVRVRLPGGQPVNLFVVHLNAGWAWVLNVFDVRQRQLGELAAFIASKAPARYPTIVMGDFNIRGECASCTPVEREDERTELKTFLSRLAIEGVGEPRDAFLEERVHDAAIDGWTITKTILGRRYIYRYDYFLYYPGSGRHDGWALEYVPASFAVESLTGSDHRAIRATFKLHRP